MKFTFLGTGTSHGIPMIGCSCTVCRSTDSKNRRRRCSLYVVTEGRHLVFDTPPDFRDQVLRFGVALLRGFAWICPFNSPCLSNHSTTF